MSIGDIRNSDVSRELRFRKQGDWGDSNKYVSASQDSAMNTSAVRRTQSLDDQGALSLNFVPYLNKSSVWSLSISQ